MSPRRMAGSEVQRILALVPWIVAHPGTAKAEIAERFGLSTDELDEDLGLVLMIGVPPYSPGDYLDVEEDDDGHITIRLADPFRRPLRLTPAEGLALLAAGRALLAVPGSEPDGPLATALRKLEAALDLPDLVVEVGAPGHLDEIRAAAAHDERVEIDYWSAGRDEMTTRRIDPSVVFYALGAWYVGAYCHRANAERMFRVDRIRGLRRTGEHFEPAPSELESGEVYNPHPDDPTVTLRLAPAASWVAEAHPTRSVTERADGFVDVTLTVSEPAWLDRLLLRLGSDAEVIDPPGWRGAGAAAARRVLARYTDASAVATRDRAPGTATGERSGTSAAKRA